MVKHQMNKMDFSCVGSREDSDINPLVSIIVPLLNEREHLLELVKSILQQTYRPLEVIFVDGGSSDGTRFLIKDHMKHFSSASIVLKLFYEEEFDGFCGPAHARNIGINSSTGDFIILLDADTKFMDQESVMKLKCLIDQNDFVKVKVKIEINSVLEKILSLNGPHYCHCGYKKWIFNTLSFDEKLIFGEDRDLWFRIEKELKVMLFTSEEPLIIRHFPHTYREYFNQTIWYARSYYKFVETVLEKSNLAYLNEISNTFLGVVLLLFLPLFFMFSCLMDLHILKKIYFRFVFMNFLRRCVFSFYVLKSSIHRKNMKMYICCVSFWLSHNINSQ